MGERTCPRRDLHRILSGLCTDSLSAAIVVFGVREPLPRLRPNFGSHHESESNVPVSDRADPCYSDLRLGILPSSIAPVIGKDCPFLDALAGVSVC